MWDYLPLAVPWRIEPVQFMVNAVSRSGTHPPESGVYLFVRMSKWLQRQHEIGGHASLSRLSSFVSRFRLLE
jgi:hypothetical protein